MDNGSVKIMSAGKVNFYRGLEVAFSHGAPERECRKCSAWIGITVTKKVREEHPEVEWLGMPEGDFPVMVLLGTLLNQEEKAAANLLPYRMGSTEVAELAWGWLRNLQPTTPPKIDGGTGPGFFLFTDRWGHVLGHRQGIVGIAPAWALYGK